MRSLVCLSFITIFALLLGGVHPAHAKEEKKIIIGYVEKVNIPQVNAELKAKMDTGAGISSIHASIIETSEEPIEEDEEKEGEEHPVKAKKKETIVFKIVSDEGESKHIKKPVVRWVKIKKKEGGHIRRPVVMMKLCIAGALMEGEVNLADRDHFNYDVLIGRNMMQEGNLIIDPTKTFTAKPNCPAPRDEKDESDNN